MKTHYRFPSIEQFKNVVKYARDRFQYVGFDENDKVVYDRSRPLPVVTATGYVKLHGSNAAVVSPMDDPDNLYYQSRENILTLDNGLAGFVECMMRDENQVHLKRIFDTIKHETTPTGEVDYDVVLFGEWCGGNVQNSADLALKGLNKRFVIFKVGILFKDGGGFYIDEREFPFIIGPNRDFTIDHISRAGYFKIEIDLADPDVAQNKLIEITNAVEQQCPYGHLNGSDGIGEGVVWSIDNMHGNRAWFKVKGEKHAVSSKVKTLNPIDMGLKARKQEVAEMFCTDVRIEQGVMIRVNEYGETISPAMIPVVLKWVMDDIVKEHSDELAALNFSISGIAGNCGKLVATKVKSMA